MSVVVEIADEHPVVRDAIADIRATDFSGHDGGSPADEQAEYIDEVTDDPVAALHWLVDPMAAVERDGVEVIEAVSQAVEVDEDGHPIVVGLDFVALFPTCRCGTDDCDDCSGFQVTPRTAASLHAASQILADQAYDDIQAHGDDPVSEDVFWNVFDGYPKITWRQDAIWRRQAARAFDDLAGDLEQGEWPLPRCAAEEMALHRVLAIAKAGIEDDWLVPDTAIMEVEPHIDDYDWLLLGEVLFQDRDILTLFDLELDGIEDPSADQNRLIGMGDYRPQAWFQSFDNMDSRDPRRPFRR